MYDGGHVEKTVPITLTMSLIWTGRKVVYSATINSINVQQLTVTLRTSNNQRQFTLSHSQDSYLES